MARRKSWKHYSGYTRAKRQSKRELGLSGATGAFSAPKRGQQTAVEVWPFAIGAIFLLVLVMTFILDNLLVFGFGSAVVLVGLIAWQVISNKQKKEREKQELIRQAQERKRRKAELQDKYRDQNIVKEIMDDAIWMGQTADMLTDSLGQPDAVDIKALKTKKKEIWKYFHKGGNRYGARVTLDNDVVVKMDVKDEHIGKVGYIEW